jgi:hypothetical protein
MSGRIARIVAPAVRSAMSELGIPLGRRFLLLIEKSAVEALDVAL